VKLVASLKSFALLEFLFSWLKNSDQDAGQISLISTNDAVGALIKFSAQIEEMAEFK